jgi:hypothetical protein
MSRRRLLAETDARELAWWRAKERIDGPYGKRQAELRTARALMHLVAALSYGSGEAHLVDYLPTWYQEQPEFAQAAEVGEMSEEEMRVQWAAAAAAWNQG